MHKYTLIVVACSSNIEAKSNILSCVIREIHIHLRSIHRGNLRKIVIACTNAIPFNFIVSLEGLTTILANIYAEETLGERTQSWIIIAIRNRTHAEAQVHAIASRNAGKVDRWRLEEAVARRRIYLYSSGFTFYIAQTRVAISDTHLGRIFTLLESCRGEIIVLRHGSCKYLPIILRELLHLIEGLEERNTIVGEHLRMTRPNGGFGC